MSHCIIFRPKATGLQITSTAQNKRTRSKIPKKEGGSFVCFAVTGKASPALEHQEPSYLSSVLDGSWSEQPGQLCDFL